MTALLASVRSFEEAEIALAAGVDILDLKEPAAGALGAVPTEVVARISAHVDGRLPVSATVGDLLWPEEISTAVARTAAAGADIVKVGFFDPAARGATLAALAEHARRGVRIVAVLFADRGGAFEVEALAAVGLHGVMIDTADKRAGSLRSVLDDATLRGFVNQARQQGLISGLAGSLRREDIAPLLALHPDYLGFRGALCAGRDREARLSAAALRGVRSTIPPSRIKLESTTPHNLAAGATT